jgi:hypothetical protein
MFRKLTSNAKTDFETNIPEYSDEKIIEILKQRDYYQAEAAKLAINEAIKRGIIFSEQDLFADDYKVEELKFSMIPKIVKPENKDKIRKSIARSLVICGVMPLVFGFLKLNSGNTVEGGLILLLGLTWIFSAAQLVKSYQSLFVFVLLADSIISFAYVLFNILLSKSFVFMDVFIPVSLFLLIVYGLFFLKRICEH